MASGFTTSGNYYLTFPSNFNKNWNPTITNTYRLAIPYTGLYTFQLTVSSDSNAGASMDVFVSKNLGNGADTYAGGNNTFCQSYSNTGTVGGMCVGCSGTAFLLSTDYLCFGFFLASGTMTYNGRSSASITLLQRTA